MAERPSIKTPCVADRYSGSGERIAKGKKWTLQRVRLNSGGYDAGGAYWGCGEPLYWASCGDVERFFRAPDRHGAKARIREEFSGARFYR